MALGRRESGVWDGGSHVGNQSVKGEGRKNGKIMEDIPPCIDCVRIARSWWEGRCDGRWKLGNWELGDGRCGTGKVKMIVMIDSLMSSNILLAPFLLMGPLIVSPCC
jgi:hypothetical protein